MIIFNFFPVVSGGGLQNSLSFLSVLSRSSPSFDFVLICRRNSLFEGAAKRLGLPYLSFRGDFIGRICFEFFLGWSACRAYNAECIFTLFGNPPVVTPSRALKISGFAYSNIIQPEVDFWDWLPWRHRLKKRLIDIFRLWAAKSADVLVLETDYLCERARQGRFKGMDVRVVKMAPSNLVVSSLAAMRSNGANAARVKQGETRILFLSGPHPNKRIHLLPALFSELSAYDRTYKLITTLPEGDYLDLVCYEFERLGISYMHENVGPVAPEHVAKCLCDVDAVINVARLESFSNNWVEAWAAGLPLIVSDAQWARASCGDAAVYVDIDSPSGAAAVLHAAISTPCTVQALVAAGNRMLASLPTAEQRTQQYIDIIESALSGVGQ